VLAGIEPSFLVVPILRQKIILSWKLKRLRNIISVSNLNILKKMQEKTSTPMYFLPSIFKNSSACSLSFYPPSKERFQPSFSLLSQHHYSIIPFLVPQPNQSLLLAPTSFVQLLYDET